MEQGEFFSLPLEAYLNLVEFLPAESASLLSGVSSQTQRSIETFNQEDSYWLAKLKELLQTDEIGADVSPKTLYKEVYNISTSGIEGWKDILSRALSYDSDPSWFDTVGSSVAKVIDKASALGLTKILSAVLYSLDNMPSESRAIYEALVHNQPEAVLLLLDCSIHLDEDAYELMRERIKSGSQLNQAELTLLTYNSDYQILLLEIAVLHNRADLVKLILDSKTEGKPFAPDVDDMGFGPSGDAKIGDAAKLLLGSPRISDLTKSEILRWMVDKDDIDSVRAVLSSVNASPGRTFSIDGEGYTRETYNLTRGVLSEMTLELMRSPIFRNYTKACLLDEAVSSKQWDVVRTILTDPAVSFDKQWGLETEEVNKLIITGEHADVVELILLSNVSTERNMAEYLHTAKASGNERMVKFIEVLL